ncbi:MAG: ribonuclease III family protein [Nitrososphaerota archaeon]|nr:hypothetical protein [Candidatus Bathyarchaeota archaeon]MDW8048087.1 ribonuclease III family protein [Nitrososphaerota archaeon]
MSSGAEPRRLGVFSFAPKHENISAVLEDRDLASLGDAFVNFLYSLALSKKCGRPVGRKVDSSVLASALRKADLRKFLPSRTDRHRQADAAESIILYGWMSGAVDLEEAINIIESGDSEVDAFAILLRLSAKNLNER